MRRDAWQRFGGFALVGAIGFACDAGTFAALSACGMPELAARATAFVPASLVTWALNRALVFGRGDCSVLAEYSRYVAVQCVGLAVNFACFVLVRLCAPTLPPLLALAAGAAIGIFSNFTGIHRYVFPSKNPISNR